MDSRRKKAADFLRQRGLAVGTGIGAVLLIVALVVLLSGPDGQVPRRVQEIQIVNIMPPPPPPPEPVRQETPVEQKMLEQPKITEPEVKPKEPPKKDEATQKDAKSDPEPGDSAPAGLDAPIDSAGNGFNLPYRAGGGLGGGGGGGGGSRWGWYAYGVQNKIEELLRKHEKTRHSRMRIEVRVWLDAEGHAIRVQLGRTTGDPEVDRVIQETLLVGVSFGPPPRDMPMPMRTRITARQPT